VGGNGLRVVGGLTLTTPQGGGREVGHHHRTPWSRSGAGTRKQQTGVRIEGAHMSTYVKQELVRNPKIESRKQQQRAKGEERGARGEDTRSTTTTGHLLLPGTPLRGTLSPPADDFAGRMPPSQSSIYPPTIERLPDSLLVSRSPTRLRSWRRDCHIRGPRTPHVSSGRDSRQWARPLPPGLGSYVRTE
jgi:hypothetical protein